MQVKLAIVILNWNGQEMLRRFLPSVIACSAEGSSTQIVVADNHSTDDSLQILQQEFPSVKTIVLEQNYGFAEGYNKALSRLEATYYLLLNSDVEVTDGWLRPLLDYMDKHPEVAACQPKLLSYQTKHTQPMFEYSGACGGYLDKYGYPFCRGRVMDHIETDRGQYDNITPIMWASGAALMVRSCDYWAVGGLDGRFFAHMEEIDFCWRLRSRGRKIVCIPKSVVYHVGGGTLHKENPRKTYLNFRNNFLMLYKNLSDKELKPVMRIRSWLDYIAVVVFLFKGEARSAHAVIRARKDARMMLPQFYADRQTNLEKTVVSHIPEYYPGSLLWNCYIRGYRRFDGARFTK